jgi:glycosyltransferase involved in cell wall biosynthesis
MRSKIIICRANPLAPDPRVDKIARALAGGGYEIIAIGWNMSGDLLASESRDSYALQRLTVPAQFGRGISNIRHQIRWQRALLNWLIEHRREYQVIHACDFDTVLPALLCKALYGKKVVYDIFDFYAEMLRATPSAVVRLIRFIDLKAIDRVDAVILADRSRLQQIEGSRPKRLELIYNTAEDNLSELSTIQMQPKRQGRLHIAYTGNIQVERGLLILLDILEGHPDWTLDLSGFGGDEDLIRSRAQDLPNVTWHGRVPYVRGLQLSHIADVLFATYDPSIPNNRYASPNKIFEAMMLGKPVIVARGTNMDSIIEEQDCGLIVEYGNNLDLEAALLQLDQVPTLRQRLGENARTAFEKKFNWENMKLRLLDLYGEIISG